MYPLINILGKEISTYSLFALLGIFAAGIFVYWYSKKKGVDELEMIFMLIFSSVGVLIGSHFLYGITNIDRLVELFGNIDKIKSLKDFIISLAYIFGGAVFYGGLILGVIFGYLYVKKKKLDLDVYSDIAATSIPLFHAFGRIGCFMGGCCYGIKFNFGFVYTHSFIEEANGVTRFPIQLLESISNFLLFFFLFYLLGKSKFKGKLLYIYLLSYSVLRFMLEFLRGDDIRGFIFGLSTSQFISIFIFIFAIIMLYLKKKKKQNSLPN